MNKVLKALRARKLLRASDYTAEFPDEGQQSIGLPRTSFLNCFSKQGQTEIKNSQSFMARPRHEVLFRRIVYLLYKNGVISKSRSVIDIGAWIGDNTLIWANLLNSEEANVIAIDPSPQNIIYLKLLAYINGVDNIVPVTAVCSDEEGRELCYEGNINHTTFTNTSKREKRTVCSTTIDTIVASAGNVDIGFFHIDVEGMEKEVLIGSLGTIRKSLPVICFEQHIESDPVDEILVMLNELNYTMYMLNEALPGNYLDCRNIFSFPSTVDSNKIIQLTQSVETKNPYFRLVMGNSLIPLNSRPTHGK